MACEGWDLGLILSAAEKDTLCAWHDASSENAGSSADSRPKHILDPLVRQLPEDLAPSLLSATQLVLVAQSWHFVQCHAAATAVSSCVVGLAVSVAWLLREVAQLHATHALLTTPVGELFGHACDLATCIFIAAAAGPLLLRADSPREQWCCTQAVHFILLWLHHQAFQCGTCPPRLHMRPLARLHGRRWAMTFVLPVFCGLSSHVPRTSGSLAQTLFIGVAIFVAADVLSFPSQDHLATQRRLMAHICMRSVSWGLRVASSEEPDGMDVLCEGLFGTIVSMDLVLAALAGRELHPVSVLATALTVIPGLPWLSLLLAGVYYAAVFADLILYLQLPLFGVCRNVYCDGVYDLCHIGHKNAFKRASKFGHRLFVGVVGDKDARQYKRPPVMSAAEREAEVAGCKGVFKVISNAPCFGLTEEFLRQHRIHVVAFGQEYLDRFPNPDDDPYYKVPRKLGIARPVPRTESFSTSELLARIQRIDSRELAKKSPT